MAPSRRLGSGTLDSPYRGDSYRDGVLRLMAAIHRFVPAFVRDLRAHAGELVACQMGVGDAFDEFMKRWHLVVNWDPKNPRGAGLDMMVWKLVRNAQRHPRRGWPALLAEAAQEIDDQKRSDSPWPREANESDPLAPVGFNPRHETMKEAQSRWQRHCKARLHAMRKRGHPENPLKFTDDHFDWFARYQVGGQSYALIADDQPYRDGRTHASARTVQKGVQAVADLLQLAVRQGQPGRPLGSRKAR